VENFFLQGSHGSLKVYESEKKKIQGPAKFLKKKTNIHRYWSLKVLEFVLCKKFSSIKSILFVFYIILIFCQHFMPFIY